MRVGLVSDTHVPEAARALPPELEEAFRGVDLILHAGDIYDASVLDDLERIAPVLAARGDDDYLSTSRDSRVKDRHIIQLDGKTLWLVHMRGYYIVNSLWISTVFKGNESDLPDIVVFGHEHRTAVEHLHGVLFVSPGSPTFLEYRRGLGTIGILDIDSGKVDVKILQLSAGQDASQIRAL